MKIRISILTLLLFYSITLGATSYVWNGSTDTDFGTNTNWTPNGVPGAAAGDDITFNATSNNCVLDANPANALDGVTFTSGYTGDFDFAGCTLDVDGGDVDIQSGGAINDTGAGCEIQCEGNFTTTVKLPATMTVTLNGNPGGNLSANVSDNDAALVINQAGTTTPTTTQYWGKYTWTAGTCNWATNSVISHLTADATMSWGPSTWQSRFYDLCIDSGITLTISASAAIDTDKISSADDTAIIAQDNSASFLSFTTTARDNFWAFLGRCDAYVWFYESGANSTGGAINLNDNDFIIRGTGGNTLTFDDDVDLGAGDLKMGVGANDATVVFASGKNLACDDVDMDDGLNKAMTLDLADGTHTVATISSTTAGAGAALDFGTSAITLSGTLNGTNITCTAGTTPIISGSGASATISNVNLGSSNYLDARAIYGDSIADGGNNTNVRFARGLIGGGVF